MSPTPKSRDHRDEPTYWFAILEIARERGVFDRAAEAQRELRRLGVHVSYERIGQSVATEGRSRG